MRFGGNLSLQRGEWGKDHANRVVAWASHLERCRNRGFVSETRFDGAKPRCSFQLLTIRRGKFSRDIERQGDGVDMWQWFIRFAQYDVDHGSGEIQVITLRQCAHR